MKPAGRKYIKCPKCGYYGARSYLIRNVGEPTKYKVRCSVCHFATEKFDSPLEAENAWNSMNERTTEHDLR